jgi:transcriptional regulator with XRE-family HTH domain
MAERARIYPLRREAPPQPPSREPLSPEPLWREVLGQRLRTLRLGQAETLSETAARAGLSPQYLSEIERGRKEPSSEMIAALAGALDTTLADLTLAVTEDLRRLSRVSRVRAGARAEGARVADISRPAAPRMPAPPVALAMAA